MNLSSEIKAFFETAREYCVWAEKGADKGSTETLVALTLVSALYHKALFLPETEPELPFSGADLSKSKCTNIYERFKAMPFLCYAEIYDPTASEPQEPVTSDIADDLRDIYVDLQEGILLYKDGHTANAVFHWRNTFGLHWGRHAVSAMKAIHCFEMKS